MAGNYFEAPQPACVFREEIGARPCRLLSAHAVVMRHLKASLFLPIALKD
jgi:hypothetical protein